MNIELDDGLADRLKRRAEANDFDSASKYTTTLLRTVIEELDRVENDSDVEERLEDLGYL